MLTQVESDSKKGKTMQKGFQRDVRILQAFDKQEYLDGADKARLEELVPSKTNMKILGHRILLTFRPKNKKK